MSLCYTLLDGLVLSIPLSRDILLVLPGSIYNSVVRKIYPRFDK